MGNKSTVAAKRSIGGIAFSGGAAIFFLVVGFVLILEVPVTVYRQEAAWQWPSAQGNAMRSSYGLSGPERQIDVEVHPEWRREAGPSPRKRRGDSG
jgi:hypothetical protein